MMLMCMLNHIIDNLAKNKASHFNNVRLFVSRETFSKQGGFETHQLELMMRTYYILF